MPWTFNLSSLTEGERDLAVFGQLSFSGSYATGGDSGSFVIGGNTIGWPDWRPGASALHAALPPIAAQVALDGGYTATVAPAASGSASFKIKIVDPATHSELAAAAYPAALTGAGALHTLALRYRKNL
ncbi:MAG TPA: hypothetical protein VE996_08285 [Terriglobales bacterium]|nr:hypothetical protein [Terriglobales bacterium]